MKAVSIFLSIIVALLSLLAFKEHVFEIITTLQNKYITNPPHSPSIPQLPPSSANMSVPRAIRKAFLAAEQAEGAGARVRRSIGTPQLRNFSPFLMLDHFSVAPGAGFPDHPHRGQETITLMLSGAFDHEDFAGNAGTIRAGDLQFMTAGRGIVHSEMPAKEGVVGADGRVEPNTGLQLWVDLPRELKACEPRYRDLRAEEIPVAEADEGRVKVKVISGKSYGVDSVQDLAYTPVWLLDVTVKKGGKVVQEVPKGFNVFVYTLEGTVKFGAEKKEIPQYHNVVFEEDGDLIVAENENEKDARFFIVGGKILDQPVVQYGPFVLSTQAEVKQALFDYQMHTNGFERADGWASEIGKSMA